MKSIKDLRESYNLITEKEENEEKKLVALVRAGLFDAKKLPALKKALDKTADKMTAQEKRMLLNLLDELMSQVITNQPVYQKVKQNLMKEEKKEYPVDQTIPSVVLLKRKAIRTFPNGQKVALYYAQSIDKYVSIPYNEIGINEEVEMAEGAWDVVKNVVRGVFSGGSENEGGSDNKAANEPKQFTPYQPKLRAKTSMAKRGSNRSSIDSRDNQLQRKALSTQNNLNEFKDTSKPETNPKFDFRDMMDKPPSKESPSSVAKKPPKVKLQPKSGSAVGNILKKAGPILKPLAKGLGRVAPILDPIVNAKPAGDEKERAWELDKSKRGKIASPKDLEKQAGIKPKSFSDSGIRKTANKHTVEPKSFSDSGIRKSTNPYSKPTPKIETTPKTDGPKREVEKRLEADKLPDATSKTDVGNISTAKNSSSSTAANAMERLRNADKTNKNPFSRNKPKSKEKTEKGKKGPGAGAALAGAAVGALFGLGAGSTEAKPFTPGTPKLKATVTGPQRIGGGDAEKERMDQLQRKALKSQINETVDLDGNIFELNSIASKKVTSLYESLNQKNKKKMIEMMKESDESLEKVISFAVRQ